MAATIGQIFASKSSTQAMATMSIFLPRGIKFIREILRRTLVTSLPSKINSRKERPIRTKGFGREVIQK